MKIVVANSCEMTCNPNQLVSALLVSQSFGPTQDGLGMFGVAVFQSVSIASRKDRIARLRLRLRPANMNLSLYQFSESLNGIETTACFSRKRPRRVLLRKALSSNIVISTVIKDCRSDGCLERLSSKTAEVMAVLKDCHQRLPK